MPRHGRHDPRVTTTTANLARLVLKFGSVNALAEGMSEALGENGVRIYPNRIHGLLSEDESRGVNTATLTAMESAIAAIPEPEEWGIEPEAIRRALENYRTDPRRVARVADQFNIPPGVVRSVADSVDTERYGRSDGATREDRSEKRPDWSWQDLAVKYSLDALRKGTAPQAGLIVPTGGGKTRVALRVALDWLDHEEGAVLWVTHRHHLRRQARRTLQELIKDSGLSAEHAAELFNRVRFVMTHRLAEHIYELPSNSMIIVDEAHRMAATSYKPIHDQQNFPTLLLTATPNRADALPIGIDDIAYTTSYRHLFEAGCVIEPTFDPPEEMPTLDWSSPSGLCELADYLLDRTESDFSKPLVAVSLVAHTRMLWEAIQDRLAARGSHPLSEDDIGFVHSGGNSGGIRDSSDFLDEFSAKPAGILIATSQLVGEGFDDPAIDAAVITYPSVSIGHLMQVAGRALRSAPGKTTAHVVQVRKSPLEYYFDQRWLYQDISDELRPDLIDLSYSSLADLEEQVKTLLAGRNVAESTRHRIEHELKDVEPGDTVNMLLSGLNYYGSPDAFDTHADWNAILVPPAERDRFRSIFNDVSDRTDDIKESATYLSGKIRKDLGTGSLWKSYGSLISAMEFARREIKGIHYHADDKRGYLAGRATTWLKYVTFQYRPTVPQVLADFLADAYNRDELFGSYTANPERWALALRVELPLAGSQGLLLDVTQAAWFTAHHNRLVEQLRTAQRSESLEVVATWRSTLDAAVVPIRVLDNFSQFLRQERQDDHILRLREDNAELSGN